RLIGVQLKNALGPLHDGRFAAADRAAVPKRVFRRLGEREVEREHRVLGLPDVHGVEQRVAPELARRHGDQVLGMDRRDDALPTAILAAIYARGARGGPAVGSEPHYPLREETA